MKTRAILAGSALIFSSIVPVLNGTASATVTILDLSPPTATGPNSTTEGLMDAQCDAKATAHGAGWTGTVDLVSITPTYVSGPTEVAGTRDIDETTKVGAGTFTPGHIEIEGDPYRNGGSVNMFGDAVAVGGHYSASAYDFTADFETTYSYAFNCTMTETVQVGHHSWNHDPSDAEDQQQNACDAHDNAGQFIGEDIGHCFWVSEGTDEAERPDEIGSPIVETQTDSLLAHEDAGEGFDTEETLAIGQVVVCISPSSTGKKLPGAWTAKNGYDGGSSVQGEAGCNTGWYNGGATLGVSNLNDGSHNWVTVPLS